MRVLAVTNYYPTPERPGDAPCIREQVETLRKLGIEVDVLQLDRTRRRSSYLQLAWRLFLSSFTRKRYDLIHAYYGYSGLLALLQRKSPVVVTFRGSDLLSRRNKVLGPLVAKWVDGVIVMSKEMQRVSGREDARIIPFGVDLNLFRPYPMEQAREDLGWALTDRLVLFPWDPERREKRFDIVRAAVEFVQKEMGDVRLVTVWDQPPEIVVQYMNACNVLVLASDREGAPVTVREAIACDLPVVSVDVGDVSQVIGDIDGCYVCRQDPEDMAEKLRMVLQSGQRLGGSRAASALDVLHATQQVVDVYQGVLAKACSRPRTSPARGLRLRVGGAAGRGSHRSS
jgi:glycosyltransferase involved in cell wall biosynthesis